MVDVEAPDEGARTKVLLSWSRAMGIPMELELLMRPTSMFNAVLADGGAPVLKVFPFDINVGRGNDTSGPVIDALRRTVTELQLSVLIGGGTRANFTELNGPAQDHPVPLEGLGRGALGGLRREKQIDCPAECQVPLNVTIRKDLGQHVPAGVLASCVVTGPPVLGAQWASAG